MFSKKLNALIDKAKEKASEIQNMDLPGMEEIKEQVLGKTDIEPDFSEHPHLPVIEYQTMINQLQINHETGVFTPKSMNIYYLPTKDINGKSIDYEPVSKNPENFLIKSHLVKKEASQENRLTTFYFHPQTLKPRISTLISATGSGVNNKFPQNIKLNEAGTYEMQFYIKDRPFCFYEFEVVKTKIDSTHGPFPYMYTIGGNWENKGLLRIGYNEDKNFKLTFLPLIAYKGIHILTERQKLRENSSCLMQCNLKKDDKLLGSTALKESDSGDIFGDSFEPEFFEQKLQIGKPIPQHGELFFRKTADARSDDFKLGDLSDGDYSIEIITKNIADRPDFSKTYPFTIKNGSVVPEEASDRNSIENPLHFIEAGRDFEIITAKS